MKRLLQALFVYDLIFWLSCFMLLRLAFIIYNHDELRDLSFMEAIPAFWHGLKLDLSACAYILGLPFLLYSVYAFAKKKWLLRIRDYYTLIVLVLIATVSVADLELYAEWGVKINSRAIGFLEHPSEVFRTTRTSFLIMGLLLIIAFCWMAWKVYRRIWKAGIRLTGIAGNIAFVLCTPPVLFFMLRGGTGSIPIQVSDAYFSKNDFLNQSSANTVWQLVHSILENRKLMDGNPFVFMEEQEARHITDSLHRVACDSTIPVLNTTRPNIVMIVMEGVSADVVEALGGFKGVTPNFDKLVNEGISFDSLVASGNLSDQGMSTIFSGFPAQPLVSITSQPDKFRHLPSLNKKLKQAGYQTGFLFGGELSYGNMRAYMMWNDFDAMKEFRDFGELPGGKLGIHDEFMFAELLKLVDGSKAPFAWSFFTMSTHSPYDHPGQEKKFNFGHDEDAYVNSVHYFDKQLKIFLDECRKKSWFSNTLFIFVSDHSHRTPRGLERHHPDYRRIPLVFWGQVIRDEWKGKRMSFIASQCDLAATLLRQLGLEAKEFQWSKNLFNPCSPSFAFFENSTGFGWIRPGKHVVWIPGEELLLYNRSRDEKEKALLLREGRAYLQTLFGEYSSH